MTKLDTLWNEVNALGGWRDPNDQRATGYAEAISDVLRLIERAGGQDPLTKQVARDTIVYQTAAE